MQAKPSLLLALISFLFLFAACERDELTVVTGETTTVSGQLAQVTVDLYGRVTDTAGEPVSDALVRAGSSETRTDQEGLWRINGARVGATFGYVTFESAQYVSGSRTVWAREGSTYEIEMQLLSRAQAYPVSAANGGEVEIAGSGATILFPAAAFAKTDGTPVTGNVTVVAHFLDAADPNMHERMPGDLRARALDARSPTDFTLLTSYGMMAVELTDASGGTVELADGKFATLTFPIPEAARASAPARIPLWHFGDAGIWEEEGFAERRGDTYVGEVSHFTFWNCDIPIDFVELCGRIVFEALERGGTRSKPLTVGIESPNWGSQRTYVDSTGAFCGLVPAGEVLTLRVYGDCGEVVYEQTIGPFSENTVLPNTVINSSFASLVFVSGNAECQGVAPSRAIAKVRQAGQESKVVRLDEDGSFQLMYLSCVDSPILVSVFDYGSGASSVETSYALSDSINTGIIESCSVPSNRFVRLTIDGAVVEGASLIYVNPDNSDGAHIHVGRQMNPGFLDILIDFGRSVDLRRIGRFTFPSDSSKTSFEIQLGGNSAPLPSIAMNRVYDLAGKPYHILQSSETPREENPFHIIFGPMTVIGVDSFGNESSHEITLDLRTTIF